MHTKMHKVVDRVVNSRRFFGMTAAEWNKQYELNRLIEKWWAGDLQRTYDNSTGPAIITN